MARAPADLLLRVHCRSLSCLAIYRKDRQCSRNKLKVREPVDPFRN